ncbi:hypothetical protein SDC9_135845 [bioreactor metagenome]|uniref:Uncharacterized protein n=1 Tax=bioreactor metagenome TaxID=1076179 RepID=A0A645DHM5_9ZZZZ
MVAVAERVGRKFQLPAAVAPSFHDESGQILPLCEIAAHRDPRRVRRPFAEDPVSGLVAMQPEVFVTGGEVGKSGFAAGQPQDGVFHPDGSGGQCIVEWRK